MCMEEMWERLAAHQPIANERGYGPAWARMCEERTQDAAWAAAAAAWAAADSQAWAAAWAALAEDRLAEMQALTESDYSDPAAAVLVEREAICQLADDMLRGVDAIPLIEAIRERNKNV